MNLDRGKRRGLRWNRALRPASMILLVLAAGCQRHRGDPDSPATGAAPGHRLRIGYVLHGLNEFTQIIKKGAERAGAVKDADVDVQGPSTFQAAHAIAIFEGMVQKHVDGLVTIPMPGDVWVKPIREAVDAGIPVLTANVTSPDSPATLWFGQDEYHSGEILAAELMKLLAAAGKKSGTIVVGLCAPGLEVLQRRYDGLKQGLKGTNYQLTEPLNVDTENTANYGQWENLAGRNPDALAFVGLCSMDLPNLARLKVRSKATWLVAGYDLGTETLDAIREGTVQFSIAQHPYLQGYLPVAALVEHLRDGKPLPRGWIDTGTEIISRSNVDSIYARETNEDAQEKWYADYIAKHFSDLAAIVKPLPTASPNKSSAMLRPVSTCCDERHAH